jgi:DNA-binding response OmpR family regulator
MRVLVAEDDAVLGEFLKQGMETVGYQVVWVGDGQAALDHLATGWADLMILDLSLPKRDGMEVLAELRTRHEGTPVLVLTGRNDLDARVRCLDLGADDCLLKPFSFYELTARVRVLLRRRGHPADSVLHYADLQLHRIERRVTRGEREIELTTKEFALLEFLLLHIGECVSRTRLVSELWQTSAGAGTNVVDVYINYLRRKLSAGDPNKAKEELIETVRGAGYRLGVPAPGKKSTRPPIDGPSRFLCA